MYACRVQLRFGNTACGKSAFSGSHSLTVRHRSNSDMFPLVGSRWCAVLPCCPAYAHVAGGPTFDAHVAPALQKDAYREADKAALQEVKHIAHVLFFIFMSYLLNSLVLSPTTVQVLASVSARCKPGTPCA